MKILTRPNRLYDTARFGQPEIRVRHRPRKGRRCAYYLLRCGCCAESIKAYYSDDGLEIGGVNGAIEDWREILLPLLRIEKRGGRLIDLARAPNEQRRTSRPNSTPAGEAASARATRSPRRVR